MTEPRSTGSAAFADLLKRREELVARRKRIQHTLQLLATIIVSVVVVASIAAVVSSQTGSPRVAYPFLLSLYAMVPAFLIPSAWSRLRDADSDLQEIDFQVDLQQSEPTRSEVRAEKIFRISTLQLRRYYELNLRQNRVVFSLGIACVAAGVFLIAATLYLVLHVAVRIETQLITSVLGVVGTVFVNIVGAIYLRMSRHASDTLTTFHTRLVETNRLLLANLLASRIENGDKRESTLASLALRLGDGGPGIAAT